MKALAHRLRAVSLAGISREEQNILAVVGGYYLGILAMGVGLPRYQVRANWLSVLRVRNSFELRRNDIQHFGMMLLDVILQLLHFSRHNRIRECFCRQASPSSI